MKETESARENREKNCGLNQHCGPDMAMGKHRPGFLLFSLFLSVSFLFHPSRSYAAPSKDSDKKSDEQFLVTNRPADSMDWNAVVDTSASPCVDFYQYACGNWMKANPIPPDYAEWGRFAELADRNEKELRQILEDAEAAAQKGTTDPDQQKIGDFYASCMDEKTIEDKGLSPIQPELDRIAALKDKSELAPEIAHLFEVGVPALFSGGSQIDDKDATRQIAVVDQGGIGLPDRDYYLEKGFAKERDLYVQHVAKMLELLGDVPTDAAARAKAVMTLETDLARMSMSRVDRREPANVYHMKRRSYLNKTVPVFDWERLWAVIAPPPFKKLNVADPGFFEGLNALIERVSLDDWKNYLRWQLATSDAEILPKAFVDENFDFYGRKLSGEKEIKPRWKRCVMMTDGMIGEALGREYVKTHFPPESKLSALGMVRTEENAMGEDFDTLGWMTAATKKKAKTKLSAIANKIGYPDKWRDYSKLVISSGDALGNLVRAENFEFHRQLNKIGTPTDRSEWQMTPPTVNAYYDPQENNINFPAGILQPPYYGRKACIAQNLGAIGAVIGHEMTHAFDDQGSQYDPDGNRRNWWSKADAEAFKQKTQCLVDEYGAFTAVQDPDDLSRAVKLNGKLTLGENTADNGGVRVALMALHDDLVDGLGASCGDPHWTDDQIFFLSFAQVWCNNDRPEDAKNRATTDYHSPGRFRVNGVISNMPEFKRAFSCPADAAMVRPNSCRVW